MNFLEALKLCDTNYYITRKSHSLFIYGWHLVKDEINFTYYEKWKLGYHVYYLTKEDIEATDWEEYKNEKE